MRRPVRLAGLSLAVLVLLVLGIRVANGWTMLPKVAPMRPCPDTPNCVSSLAPADDAVHRIEPIALGDDPEAAWAELRALVLATPRTWLAREKDGYLHVVVRTPLLAFRDDLELRLDAAAGVAHVRSASRVGHSDLGVNRARVEELRRRFQSRAEGR